MELIRKYKKDILLLTAFILTGLIATLFTYKGAVSGKEVIVTVDSEEYGIYPLNEDLSLTIPGYEGGENILTIKNKAAGITDADCPDKLCVKTGLIRNSGETIICLPHRVVVRIQ